MVAGANVKFNVWRWNYSSDDEVGGSMLTGTYSYYNVPGRFQQQPANQMFTQQGLETVKTFTCIVEPVTLDIDERDEIEVAAPSNHYYFGYRFRVINARPADFVPSDRRNYLMLELARITESHAQQ
jgi:hypothetical protein